MFWNRGKTQKITQTRAFLSYLCAAGSESWVWGSFSQRQVSCGKYAFQKQNSSHSFNKQVKLNNIHISQHLHDMEGASQPICKKLITPGLKYMLY